LYGFLKEPILQEQEPVEIIDSLPIEIVTEDVEEPIVVVVPPSTSLSDLAASMLEEEGRQEVREDKRGEEEVRQEIRQEVRQEVREDKRGEKEVRDLDYLDKSILATAVSSSIFLEVSEADEEQDSAKDVKQDVAQYSTKDGSQEDALFTWLRSVSDTDEKEEGREVKKGEEEGREVKKGEEEGRKSTESIQPSLDLIEKFIATEPRITPGKVEQYTGISFAKESLEENFDWVTETMAKLYATQGKIDRARKAYKRLMELHPEKKIHFENQLKALNQRK
jgi:tetratricopeptide (TPR) repeat protein